VLPDLLLLFQSCSELNVFLLCTLAENKNTVSMSEPAVMADAAATIEEHYDLSDAQVEALVGAIEASPMSVGGETSDLTNAAALYLIGDSPAERADEFLQVVASVSDIADLHNERVSFEQIEQKFAAETAGNESAEVVQTRNRLAHIVDTLHEAAMGDVVSIHEDPLEAGDIGYVAPSGTAADSAKSQTGASADAESDVDSDDDEPEIVDDDSTGNANGTRIIDTNWFRFLAFTVVSVAMLLLIVFFVTWLRKQTDGSASIDDSPLSSLSPTNNGPSEATTSALAATAAAAII